MMACGIGITEALAFWNEMTNSPAPGPQFENGALIAGPM
jgi:hypothetical protein